MKRQLLAIFALLAMATLGNAMQSPRVFNFDQYKYNIPGQGLKVGETFTITNADPKIFSPETLKDATGKEWARKINSVYPYAGKNVPGKGTLTFKVVAIPAAAQPTPAARAAVLPVAAAVKAAAAQAPAARLVAPTAAPAPAAAAAIAAPAARAARAPIKAKYAPGTLRTMAPSTVTITPAATPSSSGILPVTTANLPYNQGVQNVAPITGTGIRSGSAQLQPRPNPYQVPGEQLLPTPSRVPVITGGYTQGQRAPLTSVITPAPRVAGEQQAVSILPAGRTGYNFQPQEAKTSILRNTPPIPVKEAQQGVASTVTPQRAQQAATLTWEREPVWQKMEPATAQVRDVSQRLREAVQAVKPGAKLQPYFREPELPRVPAVPAPAQAPLLQEEASELRALPVPTTRRLGGSVMIEQPAPVAAPNRFWSRMPAWLTGVPAATSATTPAPQAHPAPVSQSASASADFDFYNAIKNGDVRKIFALIDAGADANKPLALQAGGHSVMPLVAAFNSTPEKSRKDVMDVLVEYGNADKAILSDFLVKAVNQQDLEMVRWLLSKGANKDISAAIKESEIFEKAHPGDKTNKEIRNLLDAAKK